MARKVYGFWFRRKPWGEKDMFVRKFISPAAARSAIRDWRRSGGDVVGNTWGSAKLPGFEPDFY